MTATRDSTRFDRAGLKSAVEKAIVGWALAGGIVLLVVVAVNVLSVLGGIAWKPFPGDFELTEMGVATAAFSFLPYCQLKGENVSADIFTAKASYRWLALFRTLAAAVALLFAVLLIWRMYAGMISQKQYDYTTAILQIPIWFAYLPALISLALLVVASIISFLDGSADLISGKRK